MIGHYRPSYTESRILTSQLRRSTETNPIGVKGLGCGAGVVSHLHRTVGQTDFVGTQWYERSFSWSDAIGLPHSVHR